MSTTRFERLTDHYTTVAALHDDATSTWFVYLDPKRCTAQDCRWKGSGGSLDEAINAAVAASGPHPPHFVGS